VALGLNYSGAVVAGIVVAMGFAMLALAFTRTENRLALALKRWIICMEL
jgi:hypothetical protein